MSYPSFNLSSNGMKIAVGSVVSAGLAYIAYNSLRSKRQPVTKKEVVQEIDVNEGRRGIIGWRLKGRSCIVAGGGDGQRIKFLLHNGAKITVVAPLCELDQLIHEKIQSGSIQHWDKPFGLEDVREHEWDIVLHTYKDSSPALIADLVNLCRKKRVPISISDSVELSDFWIDLNNGPSSLTRKENSLRNRGTITSQVFESAKQLIQKPFHLQHIAASTTTTTPSVTATSSEEYVVPTDVSLDEDIDTADVVDIPAVVIGIFDGYAVARYIGSGFADVFYDFSFAEDPSSHFLRNIENQQSKHTLNFFGKSVKVLLMDIRSGAGGALYGTLNSPKSRVSAHAFMPSSGLIEMAPILHSLSRENIPCVIHSAVAHIGDDLSITPDLSDILAIQYTGVNIINSTTPQEAHDLAIVSHISSQILSSPFVHFFDLKTTARTATTVTILTKEQVRQLAESAASSVGMLVGGVGGVEGVEGVEGQVSKTKRVVDVVDAVMTHAQLMLGKKYEIFSYAGAPEATIMFVTVGDTSEVVRDIVSCLHLPKVGAVVVHLLRPWDSARFVAAIPPSVQKIVVLGPIFSEVVASFHFVARPHPVPFLINVENASTYLITPAVIRSILEYVLSTDRPTHITLPIVAPESAPLQTIELPPPTSISGEVWENPSEDIAVNIHSLLAQTKLSIAASSNIGFVTPESPDQPEVPRVKSTVFQLANGSLSAVDRANPVDFLIVYDISILKKVNVFSNLKTAGTFILQCPFSPAELEEKLPSATKREIAGKRLKLYTFEVPSVGKNVLNLPTQLAAFFGFTGLLPEFGGWQALTTMLKSVKQTHISLFLQSVESCSQSQPIPVPSAWLDAAENQDLLPAPKARFIPRRKAVISLVKLVDSKQEAVKYLMFPEAYSTAKQLRPDIPGAHLVKVTVNRRLTPESYERNVFHIEFDTTGTGLKYEIGEALGVHGHNDTKEVESFLKFYGLNATDLVALPFKGSKPGQVHVKTVEHIFTQYLDLYGRPSKEFYLQLAEYATDAKEKDKLIFLTTPDGQAEYKARVENTVTFEDVLIDFPSAHPCLEKLIELIPPIKPRHYSIASSMKMHPNSVHLLVVLVSWETSLKKSRFGHCTRYLAGLKVGDIVTVSVKPSVMTLPPLDTQPIVMAGLGTGMAPFRAFIQERAVLKEQGVEVGPIALYFGSRSRFAEYLYGEELEAYSREGILTHLGLAFSRDQPDKIYIQHKIAEDKRLMWELLVAQKGHFYLCGPTWPEADVRDALLSSFQSEGNLNQRDAEALLEKIRSDERYILELY